MRPATYTLAEFAALYGVTMDWLYRHRERLHAEAGLPRPVAGIGRPRLPRAAVDQWLAGRRMPAPANDETSTVPTTIEEQRTHLAAVYGGY